MSDIKTTPKTSMLTKLYMADTRTTATKTQIAYVQSIPQLKSAPEPITYSALDLSTEMQEQGVAKAETIEIVVLYTEEQHDTIKAIEKNGSNKHFFVQLPEATATTAGKPLTFGFGATVALTNEAIEIDGMIQEKITLYRNTDIEETKGFPEAEE